MVLVVPEVGAGRRPRRAPRRRRGERGALVVWCVVVGVALAWGTALVRTDDVGLHAAPFKGHWGWHGGWRLLPAAVVGAVVTAWGARVAARLEWRLVPVATGFAAVAWTVVLAAGDGIDRITAPLTTRFEYEPFAAGIGRGDLGGFLSTYVDRLGDYPIHVQGHPPGPVVLAWLLDRLGLGGAGWLAVVAIGAWGVAVGAALVAARAVAGERAARRAAPALAVLPAAVWAGTSVDTVFAALGAVAVALAATAVVSPGGPLRAVGAGIVFGAGLLSSYGTVPLGLVLVVAVVAAAVAAGRGLPAAAPVLAAVGLGALAMLAVAAIAGFWWPAGLEATRAAYWDGIGSRRPALYMTLVGNPAIVAIASGPLVALGLGWIVGERHDLGHLWLLPIAALVAVGVADVSQLARGEVERIWLPFVPWLALAAPGDRRGWLAAQVAVALAVQSLLVSPW